MLAVLSLQGGNIPGDLAPRFVIDPGVQEAGDERHAETRDCLAGERVVGLHHHVGEDGRNHQQGVDDADEREVPGHAVPKLQPLALELVGDGLLGQRLHGVEHGIGENAGEEPRTHRHESDPHVHLVEVCVDGDDAHDADDEGRDEPDDGTREREAPEVYETVAGLLVGIVAGGGLVPAAADVLLSPDQERDVGPEDPHHAPEGHVRHHHRVVGDEGGGNGACEGDRVQSREPHRAADGALDVVFAAVSEPRTELGDEGPGRPEVIGDLADALLGLGLCAGAAGSGPLGGRVGLGHAGLRIGGGGVDVRRRLHGGAELATEFGCGIARLGGEIVEYGAQFLHARSIAALGGTFNRVEVGLEEHENGNRRPTGPPVLNALKPLVREVANHDLHRVRHDGVRGQDEEVQLDQKRGSILVLEQAREPLGHLWDDRIHECVFVVVSCLFPGVPLFEQLVEDVQGVAGVEGY